MLEVLTEKTTLAAAAVLMLWLLVPPILSCSVGLAGNIIVMTGHSTWNLINSVSVALLNVIFNYLLIPQYGLLGAAYATALAATAISIAQLEEFLLHCMRTEAWLLLEASKGREAITIDDLVTSFIIPWTRGTGC